MPSMANSYGTFGGPVWKPAMNGSSSAGFSGSDKTGPPSMSNMSPTITGNIGVLITYIIDTVVAATAVDLSDPKISSAIMALKTTTSMLF